MKMIAVCALSAWFLSSDPGLVWAQRSAASAPAESLFEEPGVSRGPTSDVAGEMEALEVYEEELASEILLALDAAARGDQARLESSSTQFLLPDPGEFFAENFGEELGSLLRAEYERSVDVKALAGVFRRAAAAGYSTIQVKGYRNPFARDVPQNIAAALKISGEKFAIYKVTLTSPYDETDGIRLSSFAFENGRFRYLSSLSRLTSARARAGTTRVVIGRDAQDSVAKAPESRRPQPPAPDATAVIFSDVSVQSLLAAHFMFNLLAESIENESYSAERARAYTLDLLRLLQINRENIRRLVPTEFGDSEEEVYRIIDLHTTLINQGNALEFYLEGPERDERRLAAYWEEAKIAYAELDAAIGVSVSFPNR